jgi:SNF2 family DNA or RNA helicase
MEMMYQYQNEGVEWMREREDNIMNKYDDTRISVNGGILADEVGLGKTMMTINLVKTNKKKNTLILVPKSLQIQWKKEFEKYGSEISVEITEDDCFYVNTDEKVCHVVIAAHSRLNSKGVEDVSKSAYCKVVWDRVVIDEAHVIKNRKSKMNKAVSELRTGIRWALTATPVMNKMDDFINTLGWVGVPKHICQNYKEEVTDDFIKRRTKEDVCDMNEKLKLPECRVEVVKVPFENREEEKLYENVYNEMRDIVMDMSKNNNKNIIQVLELCLRVRQICCHPQTYIDGLEKKAKRKYPEWESGCTKVRKICKDIMEQPKEDKTLIFCHFIKEMDVYCQTLSQNGYKVARIDGSMSLEQRSLNVETFNKEEECKIMVIQINVGGVGYNFQVANRIYITSPSWNPSLQHQAIGRCHRTGQKKQVYVKIYTITDGESGSYIEDYILRLQQKKREIISDILKDPKIKSEGERMMKIEKENKIVSFTDVLKMFNKKHTK